MPAMRVGVLGAGPIGLGVAALALLNEAEVGLWSRRDSTRLSAYQEIGRILSKNRAAAGEPGEILARLRLCADVAEAVRGVDWAVESVVETLDVKYAVLRAVQDATPPSAFLATTASWIPISIIARPLTRPERFVGLHFYNPPWRRAAVEIIPGERSASETMAAAETLVRGLGRVPAVLRRDFPGFVGNRLLLRQYEEAVLVVADGGTPEAVDAAYRLRLGFPFGPCESMDYIGLELTHRLFDETGRWGRWEGSWRTLAYLDERLRRAERGAAAGRGFYVYAQHRWERQPRDRDSEVAGEVADLVAPVVLEGARLAREGVATAEVVETIARDCIGWPEGPLAIGRRLGRAPLGDALARRYEHDPAERYRDDGSLSDVL